MENNQEKNNIIKIKIKEKEFSNKTEEVTYYKMKYEKYKTKYTVINNNNISLINQKNILSSEIEKLKNELESEKLLRKSFQNKYSDLLQKQNNIIPNNIPIDSNNKNEETINLIKKQNIQEEKLDEEINEEKNIEKEIKCDSKLNSSDLKQKILNEITSKFDTDKLSKSLQLDFLEYGKDLISFRRKLYLTEDKMIKLEKIIKTWLEISSTLKKGIKVLINSMITFKENLVNEQLEIFDECPDLISLIYVLQNTFTDITNQFEIFLCSIDNTFINQLQFFLTHTFVELNETRNSYMKYLEEFLSAESKFLCIKKNQIKETQKENYLSQYKLREFSKYDYICKINEILLYIKVELPEKIALFIYSLISLFRQGHDILDKIDSTINDNLDKISVKYKEKEKIITSMKNTKKLLGANLEKVNTSIIKKEGFLYYKEKDIIKYFKKRYFKFYNGSIIYFKLKQNQNQNSNNNKVVITPEQIDTSSYFELCNLLFCNVRKNDKDYEYPFCFEVISANLKKTFIFQAETENEAEEWINAIRNSISNVISSYNDNDNNLNDNNNKLEDYSIPDLKESRIDKLINNNICSDCSSSSPTWISVNWLSLICIDCSSIHRSLGVQISKIRSLRLDNLDIDYIDLIESMGENNIKSILEENCKSYEKPKPNSMFTEKEIFIINKYKNMKYIKQLIGKELEDIPSQIFICIEKNDLNQMFFLLKIDKCQINNNYKYKDEQYTFMHHAAKLGKILPFKLLILLGGEINKPDLKNLKPMDYATIYKNSEICDYIVRKIEEINRI